VSLVALFSFGTGTIGILGFSPCGSAAIAEVPLARSTPKNVKSRRPHSCMENNIKPQANGRQELILQLLDTANSAAEHSSESCAMNKTLQQHEVKS
jgi:hypothetical protein